MSQSSFFHAHDQSSLLPQYTDAEPPSSKSESKHKSNKSHPESISMHSLSSSTKSQQPFFESTYHDSRASPSPPPSFYRAQNDDEEHESADVQTTKSRFLDGPSIDEDSVREGLGMLDRDRSSIGSGSSPTRTRERRRIQFAAPPPPIAGSIVLPRRSSSPGRVVNGKVKERDDTTRLERQRRIGAHNDLLLALERREKAIAEELQELLDAQSTGLVLGFGGETEESDAGSSTPTSRSVVKEGRKGIIPVRQPKRKVVGLRGARRGLLRDMKALIQVKEEELELLGEEIEKRQVLLATTEGLEKRIERNRSQLSGYNDLGEDKGRNEEAMEIVELRTEEKAVENEIREMEERLMQMKARRRWLGERIQEGLNRREARLSGYRGALREVEAEAKEFLKRPPVSVSVVMGNDEGFFALPASRRTLGMAKEWWNREVTQLTTRENAFERDKGALEEGAQLWEQSIKLVMEFEDDLRMQMVSHDSKDVSMLKAQIEKMQKVIQQLSAALQTAEERKWNLLICALGAELEAFKEGEGILRGALTSLKVESGQNGEIGNGHEHDEEDEGPSSDLTHGLDELSLGAPLKVQSLEREESEDDGPMLAELMVDTSNRSDDETSGCYISAVEYDTRAWLNTPFFHFQHGYACHRHQRCMQ